MNSANVRIIAKCISIVAAVAGAVTLIVTGHGDESGWGWLIFLAFLLS